MSEKSYVSIEQKVCSICGKVEDHGILLDKRLKNTLERCTVTGYAPCKDCIEKLDDNFIACVETKNDSSTGKMKQEEADRTGQIMWMRKNVALQMFNVPNLPFMVFVQVGVIEKIQELIKQD